MNQLLERRDRGAMLDPRSVKNWEIPDVSAHPTFGVVEFND
jgi:hypothetical protein